ncbi:MAG: HTTM domain-containing protein [Polyangiaceae bacterium]
MKSAPQSTRPEGNAWSFTAPAPIERLELIRAFAPLAILGFLASRFVHIEHWITKVGFVVPERAVSDYRQPLYIPPVPVWLAILVAIVTVLAGLATSFGFRTRIASGIFTAMLAYLALADRLEAFTVNKLGTAVAFALFVTPSGANYGIDAWRRLKSDPEAKLPTHVAGGNVRFFQALLAFMYLASGIAKARGDWLTNPNVIWSHLHDSYQTPFTYLLATSVPPAALTALQYVTLVFELGAPIWLGVRRLRLIGLAIGVGMHAAIGLLFGPVIWFSLLMITLLCGAFAPIAWLRAPLERSFLRHFRATENEEASSRSLSKAAPG